MTLPNKLDRVIGLYDDSDDLSKLLAFRRGIIVPKCHSEGTWSCLIVILISMQRKS